MILNDDRLPSAFWARVQLDPAGTPCWLWTGKRNTRGGYGCFWANGNEKYAHRVAYTALVGPIPAGLVLDHVCRRPCCVFPGHLEPVTIAENVRRGGDGLIRAAAARTAARVGCPHGHPYDGHAKNRNQRTCSICIREAGRRYRLRQREM